MMIGHNFVLIATWLIVASFVLPDAHGKKKMSKKEMFGSKSLKCLVCKAITEEMDESIREVPPNKKVETGGFRMSADGSSKDRKAVKYARSPSHLDELVDTICKEFEDYAQAKEKSNGEPTIFRIMTRAKQMSPRFAEVDIVPDDDLNTRLKFYCENIVEEHEDEIMAIFADETIKNTAQELCSIRTNVCQQDKKQKTEL